MTEYKHLIQIDNSVFLKIVFKAILTSLGRQANLTGYGSFLEAPV